MSTTRSTPSRGAPPYTVVGGGKAEGPQEGRAVSVILLDRGTRLYRAELFRELERQGFESVISVEDGAEAVDVESLAQRHPRVRFVLLGGPANAGEKLNLGMREARTPYALVLWSDMRLASAGLSSRFFDRVAELDLLCLAPFLAARKGETMPTALAPAMERQSLRILSLAPGRDGARSLFPFDYAGIYSREKFLLSGGFDGSIGKPHWQLLDFGFRAWLWGEEIRLSQALRLEYLEEPPAEDSTPDAGYKRFWLKNLAPSFRGDFAATSLSRFWGYWKRSGGDPFSARREFREAAEWVRENRFRFRMDASSLVDLWEDESP
jgi:hypothetical protein